VADSSATETNAIYASRIRKKLPRATPNTTRARRGVEKQFKGFGFDEIEASHA
jgi:hypothetical protein